MLHHTIALSLSALLPAALLGAQSAPAAISEPGTQRSAPGDSILASWLLISSNNEAALARLALTNAHSEKVKSFAQKMVSEHAQVASQLEPFAGAGVKSAQDASTTKPDKSGADSDRGQRQPAEARAGRQATNVEFNHLALIRDLGEKCLETQTTLLKAKSGAEFDRAFMQMQVAVHVQALDMVEVFHAHASADLRPTLAELRKSMQGHVEAAKLLCKQVDKHDSTSGAGSDRR